MTRWVGVFVALALSVGALRSVAADHLGTPIPWVDGDCRSLVTSVQFPVPDPPAVRIVAPQDGATLFGDSVTVRVETDNFSLAEGRHWHVWVDGVLQGMIYEDAAQVTVPPGEHRICAILGDPEHMDIGVPAGVNVTMMTAGAGTPVTAQETGIAAPLPEQQTLSPVALVSIVVLGVAAAFGGWFLGRRLPGRKTRT
jgi:hypothetical protein